MKSNKEDCSCDKNVKKLVKDVQKITGRIYTNIPTRKGNGTMPTVKRAEYSQYITLQHRPDNSEFVTTADDAPQDLKDFIYMVHKDYFYEALPNDWIYEVIRDAFEELENNDLDDITIEPDLYNSDLYQWLGYPFASKYVAEACEEFGLKGLKGPIIWNIIGNGQWLAKDRIYRLVAAFIEEVAE